MSTAVPPTPQDEGETAAAIDRLAEQTAMARLSAYLSKRSSDPQRVGQQHTARVSRDGVLWMITGPYGDEYFQEHYCPDHYATISLPWHGTAAELSAQIERQFETGGEHMFIVIVGVAAFLAGYWFAIWSESVSDDMRDG